MTLPFTTFPIPTVLFSSFVGTKYYVNTSGSDSNNGTSTTTPFKTIAKVNSLSLSPGDSVLFQGGQTFSGAIVCPSTGLASAPITFGSYGGGRATVNSGTAIGFLSTSQAGIIVQNLVFNGNGSTNNVDGVRFNNTSGAVLANIQAINVDATNYGNNGIHVTATTGGVGYRSVTLRGCLAQGCTFNPDSSGLLIDGRTMGLAGIYIDAPSAYGTGYSGTTAHYDVLIENCLSTLNLGCSNVLQTTWSGSGIVVAETNGGLVTDCQAISNGGNDLGANIAIWTYDSSYVVIDGCQAISQRTGGSGDGGGYDIDGGSRNCTIQNCFSRDNAGEGYLLDSYTDASIPAGHWSDNKLINCVSISDGSGGGGNGSRCSFQVYLNDVSAGMTNLTIANCTGYQTNAGVPVLFLDANPSTNLNTATLTGRIVGNNFANNAALDWVKSTANPASIIISNNNISAANDYSAHWNGVHYTTPAALSAAVPNVGQGGIMPLFIESGAVIIGNNRPALEIDDTRANGGDWFFTSDLNGTTPYMALFENNSFKSGWASNFDGTGAFSLRRGGTFAWSSDASFADVAADTGISRTAAGIVAVGNGTTGNASGTVKAASWALSASSVNAEMNDTETHGGDWFLITSVNGTFPYWGIFENNGTRTKFITNFDNAGSFQIPGSGCLGWSSNTNNADSAMDTGVSRIAPVSSVSTIAIGNGTPADASGTIKAKTKAGAPAAGDVPDGTWVLIRDTSGSTTKLYYNNGGSLQSVALT